MLRWYDALYVRKIYAPFGQQDRVGLAQQPRRFANLCVVRSALG
jgi:hypothetical protein